MKPPVLIRSVLVVLAVNVWLTMGCARLHLKRAAIPPPPPDLAALPPPPTPEALDVAINERKSLLERLRLAPRPKAPDVPAEELDREIAQREARIKYLAAEIEALLLQRRASEIYYRSPDIKQAGFIQQTQPPIPVQSAEEPPSVASVDQQIALRKSWLSWFRSTSPASKDDPRSLEELDAEIKQREARIAYLKGEIEALISQRRASEIYYRERPNFK